MLLCIPYLTFLHDSSTALELSSTTPPDLAAILHQYKSVFQVPHGLPPSRIQDHSTPLKDGITAVKVPPYQYPFSQKAEIERIVNELLFEGLIQPSTSPFSVPVLLVKKNMVLGIFA